MRAACALLLAAALWLAPAVLAEDAAPPGAEAAGTAAGCWAGTWTGGDYVIDGFVFDGELRLESTGGGRLEGVFTWTQVVSPIPDDPLLGRTAQEWVEGEALAGGGVQLDTTRVSDPELLGAGVMSLAVTGERLEGRTALYAPDGSGLLGWNGEIAFARCKGGIARAEERSPPRRKERQETRQEALGAAMASFAPWR